MYYVNYILLNTVDNIDQIISLAMHIVTSLQKKYCVALISKYSLISTRIIK